MDTGDLPEGDEIYMVLAGKASVQLALANRDQPYEVIQLGPRDVFFRTTLSQDRLLHRREPAVLDLLSITASRRVKEIDYLEIFR